MLAKHPGFTAVAVLTLALGIGANTGIFTVLREVVLKRLPVPHPEQLVLLYSPGPKSGHVSSDESSKPGEEGAESFSYPMYAELRDHNDVFAGLACKADISVNLAFRGQTERTRADIVSGNYFQTLGVAAAIGRTFEPADTASPGSNPVVLLAYAYWQRRFGGDTGILNQSTLVNGRPMTVVGVVQNGFDGIQPGFVPEIYVPVTMKAVLIPGRAEVNDHTDHWLKLIGRLKPGVSSKRAAAGLAPLYSALLKNDLPLTHFSETERLKFLAKKIILRDGQRGRPQLETGTGRQLSALMWLVALVLLVACANVAGLLTARGAARQREISIRLSLGASRYRLVRQLVIESCMLSIIGAAVGLIIANWTSSALVRFAAENDIANGLSGALSLPVLGFAALLALTCGVLFGAAPSFRAASLEPVSALKDQVGTTSGGVAHQRLRKTLVVSQVAFTLVLVTGAGGFARSLFNVKHIDLGMRPAHVLQFSVNPQLNGYDFPRSVAFFHDLETRISGLPGVLSLSGVQMALLMNEDRGSNVTVEGEPPDLAGTRHVLRNAIGPGHFSNLGIALLKGREFTDRDQATSPKVAVLNETMAKTFFPNAEALGRHMKFGSGNGRLDMEIVGIVKDSHHEDVKETPHPFVYIAYTQEKELSSLTYYVRTSQDPAALAGTIRKTVNDLDSRLPVYDVRPFEKQINRDLASDRLIATLAETFAVLAALLAAIGIYGLLAYTVTQRTREIGVRMALGADTGKIGKMILRDVAALIVIGVAVGLPLSYGLGHLINSMLYGVKAFEPLSMGAGLVALCVVALAAAYLPVRRATRVDPLIALRYE